MHLSAPPESSTNDYISQTEYSIHYSSVDDAIQRISTWECGALMAMLDLKSALKMVPVRHQDWELLGIYWKDLYYVDTCLQFGCRSAPFLFNHICPCHRLDPGRKLSGQPKPLPGRFLRHRPTRLPYMCTVSAGHAAAVFYLGHFSGYG